MKFTLKMFLLFGMVACASKQVAHKLPTTIEEAVTSSYRSKDFKERDQFRHPLETLQFFGLKNDMTVLEIWPSGGWYSEILAPFLADKGQYIMADPKLDVTPYTLRRLDWYESNPEIAKKGTIVHFAPPEIVHSVPDNTVDMVLTFRNIHNWSQPNAKKAAFMSFFKALKPGGVLGVVEHRADPKKKLDSKSGYVLAKDVIKLAQSVGFQLAGSSEINANPKDSKNYPNGVWSLPPSLKGGEKDKAKFMDIGESDRFTLKFVKP